MRFAEMLQSGPVIRVDPPKPKPEPAPTGEQRNCKHCGPLPLSHFGSFINRHGNHQYRHICKQCAVEYNRQYRKNPPI